MEAEEIVGSSPYPPSPRGGDADEIFGVSVPDPYRWLEDASDAGVQQWMSAQDQLARTALSQLPQREPLANRFRELLYRDSIGVPTNRRGRLFYTRRHADKEKAILYWKAGDKGAEKVLLDPNAMSEDGSTSLKGWWPSWDGKRVAYALSENNSDESVLYVRDVATGTDSKTDAITGVKYANPAWTPDSKGFYYVHLPKPEGVAIADRPGLAEVRFHRLGDPQDKDRLVFPSIGDPRAFLGTGLSRDGRHLMLVVQRGWRATDVYVADARKEARASKRAKAAPADLAGQALIDWNTKERGFAPLAVGNDALYRVTAHKGWLYIRTNEGAPNYRVFKTRATKLDRPSWKEVVPETADTLESLSIIGGRLALSYLRDVHSAIELRSLDGKLVRKVELPGIGSASISGLSDQDTAYVVFSSFVTPKQIYSTSVKSGKTALWAKDTLAADMSDVTVEQVRFPSKDGTAIPMFLVHKTNIEKNGKNPTLLYGYGGFNVSLRPSFRATAVAWLEQGGVYAMANLRGGGEFGESWHQAGMLANKQNVFDDFIGAAEHLIREGYTAPTHLGIAGGSNGGLLVGAAMTQRPELFGAVVCSVPLLDMVRYHKFGSGKTWIAEYGSAEDEAQFRTLHAYSPYHRIERGVAYPPMLMMSADSDDRVDPMHARKFTAAIQWATSSQAPALIRIEKNAGHGGADLVKQSVARYADQYAFLLEQLR